MEPEDSEPCPIHGEEAMVDDGEGQRICEECLADALEFLAESFKVPE